MARISACFLVKNEQIMIRGALESVRNVVDEIILVDDYSTDSTVKIAREYTDRIYSAPISLSFSDKRNFALAKATGDWILVLDGDERFSGKLRAIIGMLTEQGEYAAYAFARRNYYDLTDKKWTRHVLYPDYQVRLFRNGAKYYGVVDEVPRIKGKVKHLLEKYYIEHLVPDHFSFESFRKHHLKYAIVDAHLTTRTMPRPYYFVKAFVAFCYYFGRHFFIRRGFLDGVVGLKASLVLSGIRFMKHYYIAVESLTDRTDNRFQSKGE